MISRIAGTLVDVAEGTAEIECDGVWYRLFVPACDVQSLSVVVDDRVLFHTLHYLEAQGQGNTFLPRLIGFSSPEDRAFFELFTTVKGLGNRKALRALQLPFPRVAGAIATVYFCIRFWSVLRHGGRSVGSQVAILAVLVLVPFAQVVTIPVLFVTGLVALTVARDALPLLSLTSSGISKRNGEGRQGAGPPKRLRCVV